MGHTPGKGISSSAIPFKRTAPGWLKTSAAEVSEQVCRLAKKGLTPSQIGVILRDSHGVPLVNRVTGTKILRILRSNGLAPSLPEDLYHLEKMRKDTNAKYRLILVESRIHRLARYYKRTSRLPPTRRYQSGTASALVA